jgi:hypothetical protein
MNREEVGMDVMTADAAEPRPGLASLERAPLVTAVGLVEGDVLDYLESHGASALRGVVRALSWPVTLIMMAIGSLVRQGMVRGTRRDLEVILELTGTGAR